MENAEPEKVTSNSEEAGHFNRNRSFKSKQLVRSQALRETHSPPRTLSPAPAVTDDVNIVKSTASNNGDTRPADGTDASSHLSSDTCIDANSYSDNKSNYSDDYKKQPVEIQITPGGWDEQSEQRQRTKRWLGHRHHSDSSRDLLSNNPRVACVCGTCAACPHCRGRRRRHVCPTKQDSGIVCSDECPDCSDSEQSGGVNSDGRKSDTVEVDDQTFYCRCPERKEMKPKNLSLSRNDSEDKSEPSGPELVNFIKETLNKNARDRVTLLKIEKELHALVNDTGRCIVRFPVMTSYGRMLVHRCAALFQLSHHLDQTNKTSVLVSKSGTSGGRIPCTSFRQWCTAAFPPSPQRHSQHSHNENMLAKSILKRDTHSLDEPGNGALSNSRSKSLEQREREYERVRRRIFSSDNCTQDESQWPWTSGGPVKLLTPDGGRNKLLKVQSLEGSSNQPQSWRGRGAVSKSHSFGGYGGAEGPQPRVLSRQGDLASSSWRLSPSSSGYKTLSLRSTDSVTPSPTGGASPEPVGGALVWAVTDLSSVPTGALVIHPQTGKALTNPDGSVYHFDPANPPVLYDSNVYVQMEQQKADTNSEKRRGKLEKQHSFMDNECECQPTEESRKCCCECRRHDQCHQKTDKINTPSEQKSSKPTSPCKSRCDNQTNNHNELTNHRGPYEATANQKHVDTDKRTNYDTLANQRTPYESNKQDFASPPNYERSFEANQRSAYESANQRPPSFEHTNAPTNQRVVNDISANQRPPVNKLTNHEGQEVQYNVQYPLAVRNDEVTSPPQMNNTYMQPEVANMQTIIQAKVTPAPVPDPNIRPISLGNVMYHSVGQGYPFVNQCRVEQPLQPVYQPVVEEQKQLPPSPHTNEGTFRIDPSYPYAAGVEFGAQCGACVDPNAIHPTQRSYNVSYGQVEMPAVLPPPYPMSNMVLPQPHVQHYPYQEPVQWASGAPLMPLGAPPPKLVMPDLYPVIYNPYPQYNVYQQVIPQPYPICQPVYPVIDKQPEVRRNSVTGSHRQSKRNSISGSSRNTPLQTPPDDKNVPYHDNTQNNSQAGEKNLSRQNSNEIAAKIQQIKEQMAQVSTRERDGRYRRDEWKRRNSGNGILGSYPVGNPVNGRVAGTPNDETQLSSAARAIVNRIRNMQAKNYQQDRRQEYQYNARRSPERAERAERVDDKGCTDRRRPLPPVQLQYRPQYFLRQMSPNTWCRRSPGPVHPVLNHPRRPHPDNRNPRR